MKILHTIHSLNPAAGGTTYGLRGLVQCLLDQGHETEILSLDDPEQPWLKDWPCVVHAAGQGRGKYGWNRHFSELARQRASHFDWVLAHGLWQYHGIATRQVCLRAGVPYAVFPHGMLDAWFAKAYPRKHAAKQLYWWLAERLVMRDARAVFFTNEAEYEAGRKTFFPFQVRPAIAPFGIAPPPQSPEVYRQAWAERVPDLAGKSVILFLGRLHPKKGCDLLVTGFARWRERLAPSERGRWHLRLVGPREDGSYFQTVQSLAQRFGLSDAGAISFEDAVSGDEKWQELAGASALILPSHQENFGVVIAEALACHTPALISDKVNGWQAIRNAGAGFVAPDSEDGVISLLEQWHALSDTDVSQRRMAARAHFDRAMSAQVSVEALIQALQERTS